MNIEQIQDWIDLYTNGRKQDTLNLRRFGELVTDPKMRLIRDIYYFDNYYSYSDDSSVIMAGILGEKSLSARIDKVWPEEAEVLKSGLEATNDSAFYKKYVDSGIEPICLLKSAIPKDAIPYPISHLIKIGLDAESILIYETAKESILNLSKELTVIPYRFVKGNKGIPTGKAASFILKNGFGRIIAVSEKDGSTLDKILDVYMEPRNREVFHEVHKRTAFDLPGVTLRKLVDSKETFWQLRVSTNTIETAYLLVE